MYVGTDGIVLPKGRRVTDRTAVIAEWRVLALVHQNCRHCHFGGSLGSLRSDVTY